MSGDVNSLQWIVAAAYSLTGPLVYLWFRRQIQLLTAKHADQLAGMQRRSDAVAEESAIREQSIAQFQANLGQLQTDRGRQERIQAALEEQLRELKDDNLSLRDENERLHGEIVGRPSKSERRYGIATVGVSGSGKTALTLRWANDLYREDEYKATQFAKYSKRVSQVLDPDSHTEVQHLFEIYDWGGEHIEEAFTALIRLEAVHALVMVVDLGPYLAEEKKNVFDEAHIKRQLTEFNPQVLRLLFSPAVVQNCKHFILFINKSDLLGGFQEDIEKRARSYYQQLIDDMQSWADKRGVNLNVIIGSAGTGAGANRLFPYLIENILPEAARDEHLRQHSPSLAASSGPPAPQSLPLTATREVVPHAVEAGRVVNARRR